MIYINNKHVECQMFKYTDRWIEPCCHNLWGFLPSNCVSRGKKTVFSRQDRKRVSNRVFHKNTFSKTTHQPGGWFEGIQKDFSFRQSLGGPRVT